MNKTNRKILSRPNLEGKIALVTGASRGIGYYIAKGLAEAGAHIIAVARTISRLEELDDEISKHHKRTGKGEATLVPLDLQDMTGIDRLGAAIHERWGKLDILVANAAILGVISPIGHIEGDIFEKVMRINVTATWRLFRSVEPLLHAAPAGRAIVLSSHAAHTTPAFWGAYAASKAAVEAMTRCWAEETKNTGLRINLLDPGRARTAMRAQAMPGENPALLPHPQEIADKIIPLIQEECMDHGLLYQVASERWVSWCKPQPYSRGDSSSSSLKESSFI